MTDLRGASEAALKTVGVDLDPTAATRTVASPLTEEELAATPPADRVGVEAAIDRASAAFPAWAETPAPARGAVVRRFGDLLREHKDTLADLITLEVGKIASEARGEVQEMIDVCDLAVGLSRQLGGHTLPSERPGHQLQEGWQPLGPIAVISAFNFPAAVWSWNTAIALVCGDTIVWKPSERTPLISLASATLLDRALDEAGHPDVHQLVLTVDPDDAAPLLDDERVRLVSATGAPAWVRPSGHASRAASVVCCSSWAGTTRRSSPRPPTSTWPSEGWSSPRPGPPVSAAPPCVG